MTIILKVIGDRQCKTLAEATSNLFKSALKRDGMGTIPKMIFNVK